MNLREGNALGVETEGPGKFNRPIQTPQFQTVKKPVPPHKNDIAKFSKALINRWLLFLLQLLHEKLKLKSKPFN
jgi:hypothetical protein